MKAGYIVCGPLCVLAKTWSSTELSTHTTSGYGQAISSFLGAVLLNSKLESVSEFNVVQLLLEDDFVTSDLKELVVNEIRDSLVFVYIPYLRKREIRQFDSADTYWEHIITTVQKYEAAGFVDITSVRLTEQGEQDFIWLVYDSSVANTLINLNSCKEIVQRIKQSDSLSMNNIPRTVYDLYGG